MKGRAVNNKIVVLTNAIAGKLVDTQTRDDQFTLIYDQASDSYIHVPIEIKDDPKDSNPYGRQNGQWVIVAKSDHDHEIGNQVLIFENNLI